MTARVASWFAWPALLRTLALKVRLAWRLLRDPAVSRIVKVIPLVAALYVVSPLDFIPDVLPIVGQLDDLGLILLALDTFVRWSPTPAVTFHQAAIDARRPFSPTPASDQVIDAEYRRH